MQPSPALDAGVTPSPQPANGLRQARLRLQDVAGRRQQVELLLAEVGYAFEDDRFVDALGKFREAVNISRGVHALEEQVLHRSVKEAEGLAPRNWRIAASLIGDVDYLDKDPQAFAAIWKNIHASQEEEDSAAKARVLVPENVEPELNGDRQPVLEPEEERHIRAALEQKETQNREVTPPLPKMAVPPIRGSEQLTSETRGGSHDKVGWNSLQVAVSATATVVMVALSLWAFRHLHVERASKPLYPSAQLQKTESSEDAAKRRTVDGGLPAIVGRPPTEIHPAPDLPPTKPDRTLVEVVVPAPKLPIPSVSSQTSEELDWSHLSRGGIDALRDFVLKYPDSVHSSAAKTEIYRLEWQKIDQANSASLQAFVVSYPDTPYTGEARTKLADLDRIRRVEAGRIAWEQVDKNSEPAVQSFLDQYPADAHREAASSLIADLKRRAEEKLEIAEESAWKSVRLTEQNSIENYLAQFPSGKHRGPATEVLADLRKMQSSKSADAATILNVIARLNNAWNAKDVDSIVALYANLDRRSIKSQLLAAKTVSIRISPVSAPEIADGKATIQCRRKTEEVFSDGAQKTEPESLVTYVFTKRNGAWVVAGAR